MSDVDEVQKRIDSLEIAFLAANFLHMQRNHSLELHPIEKLQTQFCNRMQNEMKMQLPINSNSFFLVQRNKNF